MMKKQGAYTIETYNREILTMNIKKLHIDAVIPKRATQGSAGYDLCAYTEGDVIIPVGAIAKIPTGIAIALPSKDYVALIFGRSGNGIKHGVSPANAVGVVDSDYRGEIIVGLINHGTEPFIIHHGDRIAQMVITPVITPELVVVEELDSTDRGAGGFGSTGRA